MILLFLILIIAICIICFVKQTANHLVRHQPQLQGKGCSSSDFILGDLFSPVSEFVEGFSEPL